MSGEMQLTIFCHPGAKHFTSKLQSMADFETLETLGFRGEGLNAICYIGRVTVTSATRVSTPRGTQIVFKQTGEIETKTSVAREVCEDRTDIIKYLNLPCPYDHPIPFTTERNDGQSRNAIQRLPW